jgi:hypothetical protein
MSKIFKKRKMKVKISLISTFRRLIFEKISKKFSKNSQKRLKGVRFTIKAKLIMEALLKNFITSIGKDAQLENTWNRRTLIASSNLIEANSMKNFFKGANEIFWRMEFFSVFYKNLKFKKYLNKRRKIKILTKNRSFLYKFDLPPEPVLAIKNSSIKDTIRMPRTKILKFLKNKIIKKKKKKGHKKKLKKTIKNIKQKGK